MESIKEVRMQQVEEVREKVEELLDEEKVKEIIQSNTAEFEHNGMFYRVKKPTFKERQELYKLRCEKQVELLQEVNDKGNFKYLAEKDLRNLYQKRGIDISKMDRELKTLIIQEKASLDKLGKALKDESPDNQLQAQKADIENIREKYKELFTEKNNLFEFSIENQLVVFIYNYYSFLCTEHKLIEEDKEDVWVRTWNTLDKFYESDEVLVAITNSYITILLNEQV